MVEPAHLVGLGGALGALLRHAVGTYVDTEAFPLSTLTVNVVGSFALALVTAAGADQRLLLFVGTGVCGSFTTFSSFAFETVRLYETGERARAVGNALLNLLGSFLAVGLAWGLVAAV
jgi:CrcB protein